MTAGDGWTVEPARLSLTGANGLAGTLGLVGDGAYWIVRRNGRTVRWARSEAEAEGIVGRPIADVPHTGHPAPPADPWLAARRDRRRVGGTRAGRARLGLDREARP